MTSRRQARTAARRRKRRIRRVALTLVLVLALAGTWAYRSGSAAGHRSAPVSATASPTPAVDLDALLADAVQDAVQDADGHLAVAVLDPASGASAGYGTDSFVTASIVKVDVLATLLWENSGELTAQQKADAVLMIENSDNDATTRLWQAIGADEGLDRANTAFGLSATTAGTEGYWGLTTTTAADQLQLLRTVFEEDSVLDAPSRTYLQGLMGKIATDQDWGVSAADDTGAVHLKNGWLPRTAEGEWVINSVGRVVHDGRELLVTVLTDGSATKEAGIALVESVARAATDGFTTATGTAAGGTPAASGSPAAEATTQR
ncbi:hypothetical protein KNE206_01910 [Kitasatospora sp. NE20-6]|uniref:serine hydrolase n=1 Tax=Kitasatospora sp. NE20-6 TaxID=2859066 RepID=UPI0034DC9351